MNRRAIRDLDSGSFVHPYDEYSWFWQLFYRTTRFVYLCGVFLPCMTVAGIAKVTGDQNLRAYGLDLLVDALNAAGCGLQKFGQWLSMRPDMIPADVIAALSSLRQDIPPHNMKHTRKMLKECFGADIEEVFESFDDEPVASGTVAQVHRGRLREDYAQKANIRDPEGNLIRDVAVKVRHPNVLLETWCDIEVIYMFIQFTDFVTVPFKKDEFLHAIQKQVNFKSEAQNLVKFAENFKKEVQSGDLRFPTVSTDMISPSILLESWASGSTVGEIFSNVGEGFKVVGAHVEDKINHVEQKTKQVVQQVDSFIAEELVAKKRSLAATIFDMSIKMFLRDNLVHGDLHAGNVMYDEKGNCCTVIDAGMVTSLEGPVRQDFSVFLHALCTGNVKEIVNKVVEFHVELSEEEMDKNPSRNKVRGADLGSLDPVVKAQALDELSRDIENAVNTWVDPATKGTAPDGSPISLGDLVGEMLFSLQRHGVCLRADVASSLMTMSLTEGLIRSLDPEFDMVKESLPYFIRYDSSNPLAWR